MMMMMIIIIVIIIIIIIIIILKPRMYRDKNESMISGGNQSHYELSSMYMYVRCCDNGRDIRRVNLPPEILFLTGIRAIFLKYIFFFAVHKVCLQSGMYITRDDDFNWYG